jgi:hypothetical protein
VLGSLQGHLASTGAPIDRWQVVGLMCSPLSSLQLAASCRHSYSQQGARSAGPSHSPLPPGVPGVSHCTWVLHILQCTPDQHRQPAVCCQVFNSHNMLCLAATTVCLGHLLPAPAAVPSSWDPRLLEESRQREFNISSVAGLEQSRCGGWTHRTTCIHMQPAWGVPFLTLLHSTVPVRLSYSGALALLTGTSTHT